MLLIHLLSCDAFNTPLPCLKSKGKKKLHSAIAILSIFLSLGECCFVCFTVEDDELPALKNDSDLPIIPNYLANPPFPYIYNTMSNSIPDPSLNGSISHFESRDTDSSFLPDAETCPVASVQHGHAAPDAATCSKPAMQRAPLYQGAVSLCRNPPSPVGSNPAAPQQENGSCPGPVPAFQPVFFTGAFPLNMQGNSKVSSHFVLELLSPWAVKMRVTDNHSTAADFHFLILKHSGNI